MRSLPMVPACQASRSFRFKVVLRGPLHHAGRQYAGPTAFVSGSVKKIELRGGMKTQHSMIASAQATPMKVTLLARWSWWKTDE